MTMRVNTATTNDSATVTVTDVLPTITVSIIANPVTVSEPSGSVTYDVVVNNTSVEPVTLTTLNDDVYLDLDGQGTCTLPQVIAVGGNYTCSFTATVSGNATDTTTNTLTASADDDEGNTATNNDSATVTVTDVLPTITVSITANPVTVSEPSGSVTYYVLVNNTSVEPVYPDHPQR